MSFGELVVLLVIQFGGIENERMENKIDIKDVFGLVLKNGK